MDSGKKNRVVTGKMGIDAHDTGIITINRMLRDAGMEVVYVGLFNTPVSIVRASVEEDADILGISFHHDSYMKHIADLMLELKKSESKVRLIVGGLIKTRHISKLKEMGVLGIFPPGSTGDDIICAIKDMDNKGS